jgi:hypothetical protein
LRRTGRHVRDAPSTLITTAEHLQGVAHRDLGELAAAGVVDLELVHLALLVAAVHRRQPCQRAAQSTAGHQMLL